MSHILVQISFAIIETDIFTISQPILQITEKTDDKLRRSSEKIILACCLPRSGNELVNELSGVLLFTTL